MKNRARTALILVIFLLIQLLPWALVASPIFIFAEYDYNLNNIKSEIEELSKEILCMTAALQYPFQFEKNPDGTYTVTGIERTMVKKGQEYRLIYEEIIVPSIYKGKPVTKIGDEAFKSLSDLKTVLIPKTITHIGNGAFADCYFLKTVTMPETLDYLGERAFYNCQNLEGITIPEGITEIGAATFYWCFNIKALTIPEGVTSIGASAFSGCKLETVNFPEGLITIEGNAFKGTNLTSLDLPDSVRSIGFQAFAMTPITEFTSPASLETTGDAPFWYCHKLKTATFNSGIQKIYRGMFHCCSSLTDLYLPADVEMIETYAFNGCTSLRRIHFAGTVSEWEAIEKEDQWNSELKNCTVICTNGEINISE